MPTADLGASMIYSNDCKLYHAVWFKSPPKQCSKLVFKSPLGKANKCIIIIIIVKREGGMKEGRDKERKKEKRGTFLKV